MVKYLQIYQYILKSIHEGQYLDGDQIPTEAILASQFKTCRRTVARALRQLAKEGVLERRQGRGTFVCQNVEQNDRLLGFLVSDLPSITIPISNYLDRSNGNSDFGFLTGRIPDISTLDNLPDSNELCEQFIARKVLGVFFAPLELAHEYMTLNAQIADKLNQAGIPIVLIDRDVYNYPQRSNYDLVGIDNANAGYLLTRHLLSLGYRKIEFVGLRRCISSVKGRINGYQNALLEKDITPSPEWIHHIYDTTDHAVTTLYKIAKNSSAEAFLCVNDITAITMINALIKAGKRVPEDVAVVGIDDDETCVRLSNVPLTTLHQPFEQIGATAARMMVERIKNPHLPARTIQLAAELVIRESCGSKIRK